MQRPIPGSVEDGPPSAAACSEPADGAAVLASAHDAATPPAILRVLVVEEQVLHQAATKRLLEREGHVVVQARDGLAAIRLFEARTFDAVLVHARLPDMTAADLAQALRTLEAERGLDGSLLVAMAEDGSGEACAAGVDAVIPRPVRAASLARALSAGARAHPIAGGFDATAALARAGGDPALLREVAVICAGSMPRHVEAIESALASADCARLERAAHALKGMVANFGADAVTDAARRLQEAARIEDLARAGSEWESLRPNIDSLTSALSDLIMEPAR